MNPGVHDITIEQYHGGAGVSRSGLQEFKRSPLHYWHKYLNPEKPEIERAEITTRRDALQFGNAFHTYLLEREEFYKRYMLINKVSRATKEGKAAYAKALAEANGRELVCSESFEDILHMAKAIERNPTAKSLIDGGFYEKSLFWKDKDTNLLCKVRPDIWHKNMIVDIKTCSNASYREFQRSVDSYGYHVQAAMIHEALHSIYGSNMMNFIFIAVEKEAPYAVAVYPLKEEAVRKGIEIFKKTLFEMKDCMINNEWPAYQDAEMDLPAYAYNNASGEF